MNLQTDLFSQELVKNIDGELLVSSEVIAENIEYEHKHILELIRKNLKDFQEFGTLPFETRKSKGRATQVALLNENQSTLLITYLRNSELVKRFKINLVKAFAIMKDKLNNKPLSYEELMQNALLVADKKVKELVLEKKALEEQKQELEKTYSILMHTDKLYTVTEIAKELGFTSANFLNKKLEDLKIQRKVNNCWVLNARYVDMGYTSTKQQILDNGKAVYDRKFTQKGREFILKLFPCTIIKKHDLKNSKVSNYNFKLLSYKGVQVQQ